MDTEDDYSTSVSQQRDFWQDQSSVSSQRVSRCSSEAYFGSSEELSQSVVGESEQRGMEWQKLGKSIYYRANRYCKPNYIFHTDIIKKAGFDEVYRLKQSVSSSIKREDIIVGIIYHPEGKEEEDRGHIHVYHDCPYSSRTCRCGFLRGFSIKRRRHRHNLPLHRANSIDFWVNWCKYYTKDPRQFIHLEVAGMDYGREIHRVKNLGQSISPEEKEADGMVEGQCVLCQDLDSDEKYERQSTKEAGRIARRAATDFDQGGSEVSGHCSFKPSKSLLGKARMHDQLKDIILSWLIIPFEDSCAHERWVNTKYLSMIDQRSQEYQIAVNTCKKLTSHLSYSQLLDLHKQADNPSYLSRSSTHYLNLERSIEVCDILLTHQFPDEMKLKDFIITLYNVMERRLAKMNSIFVTGPANSGKTYFFNMVTSFYLNVGQVANFHRGQNFPLNDCPYRRVLLWNEPNIMPSAYDTVKMLTGGDPCPASIKYQSGTVIPKTPLLLTGNHAIFPSSQPVWNSRIAFYKWRACDALAGIDGYPHPLTWKYYVDKYIDIK